MRLSVGCDLRPADNPRVRCAPQFGGRAVGELPDAVARAFRRDVQQIARRQSRRRIRSPVVKEIGVAADASGRHVGDGQPPERSFWIRERREQASAVGARRQRGIPVESGAHPVRHPTFDIEAVQPRSRAIPVGGQVHQRPVIQDDRVAHASIVMRDAFGGSAGWSDAPDVHGIGQRTLDEIDEAPSGDHRGKCA